MRGRYAAGDGVRLGAIVAELIGLCAAVASFFFDTRSTGAIGLVMFGLGAQAGAVLALAGSEYDRLRTATSKAKASRDAILEALKAPAGDA